jgi:RNA polymerase sigma factor (sigma-70 family)
VSAPGDDDLPLLARLRAGDGAAFSTLYERHQALVFRFLLRLCGRRDVAEDLFQETWIRFARHARALRPDSNVRAWLYTVARNLYRSHARWTILDAASVAAVASWWYLLPSGDPPHEAAVAAAAAARLERAVGRLPTAGREVLLLVAAEGLAVDEAATILGLSPEAARQRLHRARAQLVSDLKSEEER